MNRILEKALEYGFRPVRRMKPYDFELYDHANSMALSKSLKEIIAEEGVVIPSAEVSQRLKYGAEGFDEQVSFNDYVDYLAKHHVRYWLKVKEARQAFAEEFDLPVKWIRVSGTGQNAHIFYWDEDKLSAYLRERFDKTIVWTFKMK